MKRRSYLTTHRSGGIFSSVGKLVAALLAFFVLMLLLMRLVAPGALTALVSPLWRLGNGTTDAVGNAATFASRAELLEDRDRLVREVETLRNQSALAAARATDLERLLGNRTERAGGILAGVVARPPVSPYDVLVIDQGGSAGIRVGSAAFGPGGVPLGTVTSADARFARVTLYSSTDLVTEGWAGVARVPMKLVGTGAGGFDAEIPGNAGVLVGDQVFVPGPGALPIGTVAEIVSDPSSPSVILRIRPIVNPFSITWVTVQP